MAKWFHLMFRLDSLYLKAVGVWGGWTPWEARSPPSRPGPFFGFFLFPFFLFFFFLFFMSATAPPPGEGVLFQLVGQAARCCVQVPPPPGCKSIARERRPHPPTSVPLPGFFHIITFFMCPAWLATKVKESATPPHSRLKGEEWGSFLGWGKIRWGLVGGSGRILPPRGGGITC